MQNVNVGIVPGGTNSESIYIGYIQVTVTINLTFENFQTVYQRRRKMRGVIRTLSFRGILYISVENIIE